MTNVRIQASVKRVSKNLIEASIQNLSVAQLSAEIARLQKRERNGEDINPDMISARQERLRQLGG